jgi:3',5'-cyclic AMP phosphodiesterase CpdA
MESDRLLGGPMLTWLDADLAANTQEWVIAFWHHPPYSHGSHDSDADTELMEMRQNAVDKLEEYGVDLVLCGHSHSYERSFLIDGHLGKSPSFDPLTHGKDMGDGRVAGDGAYRKAGAGMTPHEGAVYGVCGCSGKLENGGLDHPAMYIGLMQLGSMVLDFYGAQLDVRFLDDSGAVDDHFTLVKGGATPVQVLSHQLIAKKSDWKYDDTGVDLKTAWRAPSYDDSAWAYGPSFLGYGETYIATTVSYGGNPNNKYVTTYFRKSFDLNAEPADVGSLTFKVDYDDGFVAYLNGTEVARKSMPTGTISWSTLASSHEAGTFETIDLTPYTHLLVRGTNVIAVELHQANKTSSDLAWDAELDFDGFASYLTAAAEGKVDPIGGVPYDVLRVNGSTGGLGRSVDLADGGSLTIDVESPPTHGGNAPFALFAWFSIPGPSDVVPLGNMGDLCFPPIFWIANSLGIGPAGYAGSTPAPWSYTEPSVDGPIDVVLQGVIATKPTGALRTTNAVLVQIR